MRFSSVIAALTATSATAHSVHSSRAAGHETRAVGHEWCGTKHPTAEQLGQSRLLAQKEDATPQTGKETRSPYLVDVYFHAIAFSETEEDGWLSNATLTAQFDVLVDNFAPAGFEFALKGVTRTVAPEWAYDQDELAYKKTLRRGDYGTLNVYFLPGLLDVGLLGYATFPDHFVVGDDDFYLDGIVIASQSVPGGSATNYNEGKTVTHEAGHWFGLYHVFQGGCSGDGDFVRDTPAQSWATNGCPTGQDSCPDQRGLDSIHNYMDYSYDSCYSEFTAGQRRRTHSAWREYRK